MRRRTLKNGLAALRRILVAPVAFVSESDPSSFFQVGGSAAAGLSDSEAVPKKGVVNCKVGREYDVTAGDADPDVDASKSRDGQGAVAEKDEKDVLEACCSRARVSVSSNVGAPRFLHVQCGLPSGVSLHCIDAISSVI
jgi:hypothetical protein